MKLATIALATTMLIAASCGAQIKAPAANKGYDIGSCGIGEFLAVHADEVGTDLVVKSVSVKEGEVETLKESIVYKFKVEDKQGRHYISPSGNVELILDLSGKVPGLMISKGQKAAILFVVSAPDDSKLVEHAEPMFKTCVDLNAATNDN